MQTFLPYEDFTESAWSLDMVRLNNQINEALIVARSLRMATGWPNHAVTRMWSYNLGALLLYGRVMAQVWGERSSAADAKESATEREVQFKAIGIGVGLYSGVGIHVEMPEWLGDERLHWNHRQNLMRKDALGNVKPRNWYRQQWPELEPLKEAVYWYPGHHGYAWRNPPVETYNG